MVVRVCFVVVAACTLQLTRTAVPKNNDEYHKIVFPGPTQDLGTRFGQVNDTDPCAGQVFCTVKPHHYPQEYFNKHFKGKIKEPIFEPSFALTSNRDGESDDDEDRCPSRVMYEPLYQVRADPSSNWVYVAQAPEENYQQKVRIETCLDYDTPCFTELRAPVDLVTKCQQRHSVWELLVKEENEEKLKPQKVVLPACCSCYYTYKENVK